MLGVLGEEKVKVEFDSPGSTPPPVVERGFRSPEGMTTMTIDATGATSTCYIAKLEVGGRIVDDLHNTLSYFCPRIEDK